MQEINIAWNNIKDLAYKALSDHPSPEYAKRLEYEISQIEMQGARDYWIEACDSKKTFAKNPNGLILPYLIGLTTVDPINCKRQYKISDDGEEDDIVIITLDNGNIVEIPSKALVLTKDKKTIKAVELQVDDEI